MKRTFSTHKPVICYDNSSSLRANPMEYDEQREAALNGSLIEEVLIPAKSGRSWKMLKGDLCRIELPSGAQVGDLNFWNLHDTKERFYSGKTRQIHSSHLNVYDHLWSCLPYLRPMATFVYDTLADYGIDSDGGALHDVIGNIRNAQYFEYLHSNCRNTL